MLSEFELEKVDVSEQLIIRPAANADIAQVQALVFSVMREFGLEPAPGSLDADLSDLEQYYVRPGGVFVVVADQCNHRIVGSAGLMPKSDRCAELRKMYLAPEIRGQGWGRKLLGMMIEEARRRGFMQIGLETNSAFKDAIRLYTRNGFVRVDDKPLSPRCDQVYRLALL